MSSGHPPAGGLPDGKVILGAKVMEEPPLLAVIVSVPDVPDFESEAVSEDGFPGRAPAS